MSPVDRLALIRTYMKELQEEAQRIREQILSGETGRVGEWHTVNIRTQLVLRENKPEPSDPISFTG